MQAFLACSGCDVCFCYKNLQTAVLTFARSACMQAFSRSAGVLCVFAAGSGVLQFYRLLVGRGMQACSSADWYAVCRCY